MEVVSGEDLCSLTNSVPGVQRGQFSTHDIADRKLLVDDGIDRVVVCTIDHHIQLHHIGKAHHAYQILAGENRDVMYVAVNHLVPDFTQRLTFLHGGDLVGHDVADGFISFHGVDSLCLDSDWIERLSLLLSAPIRVDLRHHWFIHWAHELLPPYS